MIPRVKQNHNLLVCDTLRGSNRATPGRTILDISRVCSRILGFTINLHSEQLEAQLAHEGASDLPHDGNCSRSAARLPPPPQPMWLGWKIAFSSCTAARASVLLVCRPAPAWRSITSQPPSQPEKEIVHYWERVRAPAEIFHAEATAQQLGYWCNQK